MVQTEIQNDLIVRVAKGEKTERTPVWLMRQAGRILPEYRAVRNSLSGFKELVETPELAAEVSLQPVDILDVDAAIIFSDILVIPEAMGLQYEMVEKRGPWFPETINSVDDIKKVKLAGPEDINYTIEAIKILKKELNGRVPVIGFAGAPFTIFCYMVEGSGSKTFSKARKFLYTQPEASHQLLQLITDSTIAYLKGQIAAGASIVQIFDSWAGILNPVHYEIFGIQYIKQICDAIPEIPVTVFAKGAYASFENLAQLNCQTLGVDWGMRPQEARAMSNGKCLQGNLDPTCLYASYSEIERATKEMLKAFEGGNHIANLGHGVYPDTDPEKVKCFIQTVKAYS